MVTSSAVVGSSAIKTFGSHDNAMAIITHDMGVVAEVADDVVVMNRARVVERGSATQIFESAAEPYTKALLASVPRLGSMAGRDEPAPFDLVEYQS